MLRIISAILISYLLGAIPTAYLFGRFLKKIDIRDFGSCNVGATNALRVLGRRAGITVLLLDVLKGFLAVTLAGNIFGAQKLSISADTFRLILGLVCISGHNWTIFLKFKGGKGVATTLGVLLGLAFKVTGIRFVLGLLVSSWLAVFLLTRIISAASITSAIVFPLYLFLFKNNFEQFPVFMLVGSIFSLLIILRHRANLIRLLQGKEPKLTFKKS